MVLSSQTKRCLNKIYQNPKDSGSFGGVNRLWRSAKKQIANLNYKDVVEFLRGEDTYTLHRQYRKRYPRNRVLVSRVDQQWEADLVDMQDFANDNEDFKYMLTVVDVLSKYAWAVPVKRKDAENMTKAFDSFLEKARGRSPEFLHTDKGKEFFNSKIANLLKQRNIHHFATESDTKAAVVERFNRTLKSRMWRYFTSKNTHKWLDVLDALAYLPTVARKLPGGTHRSPARRRADELAIYRQRRGLTTHAS